MTIEQLCLSVLYEGEATGYDIGRQFADGEMAHFANASTGAIYPALTRLEAKGLVNFVIETQAGKPSRKIYRITDDGRATFVAGLREPLAQDTFQSPFIFFLHFAPLVPPDIVADRLAARQRHLAEEIERLEILLSRPVTSPQGRWVLEYGLAMTQAMQDGLKTIAHKIGTTLGANCPVMQQRSAGCRD